MNGMCQGRDVNYGHTWPEKLLLVHAAYSDYQTHFQTYKSELLPPKQNLLTQNANSHCDSICNAPKTLEAYIRHIEACLRHAWKRLEVNIMMLVKTIWPCWYSDYEGRLLYAGTNPVPNRRERDAALPNQMRNEVQHVTRTVSNVHKTDMCESCSA